jgi:signal transduction histidine kinase
MAQRRVSGHHLGLECVAECILELDASLRAANTNLERRVCERTAELETALHAKEEFLSRATPELRTPMNHVLGFAQFPERDSLTEEETERVGQIVTSGRHLMTLIDRIIEVSKPDDLSFREASETQSRSARQPVIDQKTAAGASQSTIS